MPALENLDALVFAATDPARRAYLILCLLCLELLHALATTLAGTSLPPLRSTIAQRLRAGETFDLPPHLLNHLRTFQQRISLYAPPAPTPAPAPTQTLVPRPRAQIPAHPIRAPPPRAKFPTRHLIAHRRHPAPARAPPNAPASKNAKTPLRQRTPISFRYRNKIGNSRGPQAATPALATAGHAASRANAASSTSGFLQKANRTYPRGASAA